VVVSAGAFSVSGPFAAANDLRDIAFERGGNRAFVTVNTPPSVAVLDTRPQLVGPTPGTPSNQVVDVINVCQTPSHMGVRYDAAGRPRIYVACFQSNQVMVVDPDHAVVTDTIIVGRGPNDIVFDETRQVAYVTHYGESTIGVIDLLPGSATENRLVARIGVPIPPRIP
jgi:YVTN family beta-propeller protein